MSIPINPLNPNQPTLTITTVSTPELLEIWTKSGSDIYNTALGNVGIGTTNPNGFKININGSLNATSLTGIGSSITSINYNNITLNKPTNFQCDYNTTLINKPTNFQCDYNSTLINKPTNFQADWNSTVINKPSTFAPNMTNIYTKTEVNNISNLNSNYTTNASNTLNTKINTKQDTLTALTTILGKGGSITAMNYNNITVNPLTFSSPLSKNVNNLVSINLSSYLTTTTASTTYQPILTFNSPLSKTANTVSIDLSSYLTTATASTTYQPILTFNSPLSKTANTVSFDMTNIYTKTEVNNISNLNSNYTTNASNTLDTKINTKQDTLTISTTLLGNGGSITGINYNNITTNKPTNFQADWNSTVINKPTNFQADWNSTVINKPTNFQADWNSTVINKPSTFAPDMTNIYTKTEVNSISILNSNYTTNASNTLNTKINTKQDTLTALTTLLGTGESITGINYNNITVNPLTFLSPLSKNVSNVVSIDLTNIPTTATNDGRYLKLDGTNSMTGQITGVTTINGTSGIFGQLYTTNNTNVALPSTGVAGGIGDKIIISSGGTGIYPYSIGRNTNDLWYSTPSGASFKFYSGGTNTLTLNSTGNLTTNGEISTGSSSYLYAGGLRIAGWDTGNTIYSGSTNNIGITLNYANNPSGSINLGFFGGNGNILTIKNAEINFNQRVKFINNNWNISAEGIYRHYYAANSTSFYCCGGTGTTQAHTFFNSSYANIMTILNNGNVGIGGIATPNCKLDVNGIANIHNGSPSAILNNFMSAGSLTIGGVNANYGLGSGWNTNTAGLLMECLDNTEIAIHDSGHRVASFMTYYGGTNPIITLGRDMGWGTTTIEIAGKLINAYNVCKRASLYFTPTQSVIFPYNWTYNINLSGVINSIALFSTVYVFRITVLQYTGDWGDTGDNVQTLQYIVFLSNYAGGKSRLYQVLNSTSGSSLQYLNSTTLMYIGPTSAGGSSGQKYCVIENIGYY